MTETQTNSESFILFGLGQTIYAVRSRQVQQIEMLEHVTPVPNTPPFVEGVIFSRGQVIPAINLRVRFGLEKIAPDTRTRMIVVQAGTRVIGLIVDHAREFLSIPSDIIQPPPEAISGLSSKYVEGIATFEDRLVLILNVEQILDLTDAVQEVR